MCVPPYCIGHSRVRPPFSTLRPFHQASQHVPRSKLRSRTWVGKRRHGFGKGEISNQAYRVYHQKFETLNTLPPVLLCLQEAQETTTDPNSSELQKIVTRFVQSGTNGTTTSTLALRKTYPAIFTKVAPHARLSLIARHLDPLPHTPINTPYSIERLSSAKTITPQTRRFSSRSKTSDRMSTQPNHPTLLIPGPIEFDDAVLQSMSHYRYVGLCNSS